MCPPVPGHVSAPLRCLFCEGCGDSSASLFMPTEMGSRVAEINTRVTDNGNISHPYYQIDSGVIGFIYIDHGLERTRFKNCLCSLD